MPQSNEDMTRPTVAVIGGTGAEGSGLALRWAAAGYPIIIGSRRAEKADNACAELNSKLPEDSPAIRGATNADAATNADVVVLSVPYSAQKATIDQIIEGSQSKVLITVGVPLKPPKVSTVWQPESGSAALEAQAQLGENVNVVAAFQNVSATHLLDLDWQPDSDVLVAGNSRQAKSIAIELAEAAGFFGVDAGPLANASVAEGLTAVLIGINRRNKVNGAGIRITGIPRE